MRTISTFVAMLLLISFTVAKTINVPQDLAKIQLAINAAVNGDTILISEGTYFENLILNKKIVLGSLYIMDNDTSHIRKTIIDGSAPSNIDSSSCILILSETDTNTVIKGLTLQKGRGTKGTYHDIVWRCGGGIFIYAGGATIVHNIIRDNDCNETAINAGGAFDIWPDSTYTHGPKNWVIAYNSIIENNRAAMASGLAGEGGGAVLMGHGKFLNNEVRNNSSSGQVFGLGGAFLIYSDVGETDIEVRNNLIVNNTASMYAGGISCAPTAPYKIRAVFINNIITGNSAPQNAAFRIGLGDFTFVNNTITHNISTNTNALWLTAQSGSYSFKFMNNIIWNPSCPVEFNSTTRIFASYNCVRGGLAGIGNINTNPLFVANDSLYRLSNSSLCIGAGSLSASVGGVILNAPSFDYFNTPRPRAAGTNPDMGAVENDLSSPFISTKIKPAESGIIFATQTGLLKGSLWSIGPTTDTIRSLGEFMVPDISSLTIQPGTNALYGVSASTLYRISCDSGTIVPVRILSIGDVTAIAFSHADTLYCGTSTGKLYRINITSGEAPLVGTASDLNYLALSFNPSGKLWASARHNDDSIYIVNASTGAAQSVGAIGIFAIPRSIAFDPAGKLYCLIDNGSGEDYLATLDTLNGTATLVSETPLSVSNLSAIAIRSDIVVSVSTEQSVQLPKVFSLSQNYPNPFNPSTTIRYALPSLAHVKLTIHDILGKEIATLVNEEQSAGWKVVRWDATNVSSGIYFYELHAGSFVEARKMIVLK